MALSRTFGPALLFVALMLAACGQQEDDNDSPAGVGSGGGEPSPSAERPSLEGVAGALDDPDGPVLVVRQLNDWNFALLLDEELVGDSSELLDIARPYCADLAPCRVGLWYDLRDFPTELPIPEAKLRYQVFALGRTIDGAENRGWNCNVFFEYEGRSSDCLPRPM